VTLLNTLFPDGKEWQQLSQSLEINSRFTHHSIRVSEPIAGQRKKKLADGNLFIFI
jgi:hypothetical protein